MKDFMENSSVFLTTDVPIDLLEWVETWNKIFHPNVHFNFIISQIIFFNCEV